ncbi:hypothetical protein ACFL96_13425 [Thermoproteota archaeon]
MEDDKDKVVDVDIAVIGLDVAKDAMKKQIDKIKKEDEAVFIMGFTKEAGDEHMEKFVDICIGKGLNRKGGGD